jgi:hypothetical protein
MTIPLAHLSYTRNITLPLLVAIVWLVTRPRAKQKHVVRYHDAALQVAFWEEALFRGLILGGLLLVGLTPILCLVLSSVLFGLFHLRNYWYKPRNELLISIVINSVITGPVFGYAALSTGNIYLSIAMHYMWDYFYELQANANIFGAHVPSDEELRDLNH